MVALATDQAEHAAGVFKQLIDEGFINSAIRYNLAYTYLYTGLYENARQQFEMVMNVPDAPKDALLLLSRTYHCLGDLERAKYYCQQHLEQYGEDTAALGQLALLAAESEDMTCIKHDAQK